MDFKLACVVSWELGCHLLKGIEVNWHIIIIASGCLYWFLFRHNHFWVKIGFLHTGWRSDFIWTILFYDVCGFSLVLFHLFNLLFELIVGLLLLQMESLQLVDFFEGFLKLDTQIHVIFNNIRDFLLFQAFDFLEFVQETMGLFIQECFALQILLIVVGFRFKLLQDILLSIQLFWQFFHFFLRHGIRTVLLILQILDYLWHHELLSMRFLLSFLQMIIPFF